ncbi:putative methylthioadenosine nucleosidase [Dioscorea sansibarensis]
MQKEAISLVNKFQLSEDSVECPFPKGVPWIRYHGTYKSLQINLVWPGKDAAFGVDSVGTISASLVTYASIQCFKPDLIINAGTAGGFKAKGACISDVYLASDVCFHDRRIPIPVSGTTADDLPMITELELVSLFCLLKISKRICYIYSEVYLVLTEENMNVFKSKSIFDLYGIGARQAFYTPNLVKQLNLKVCKLSTGDSLDMPPQDEASILANGATLKDMEGAAVAYVAGLFSVPTIFVKAVTDIVDGEKPTADEFLQNLVTVTAALEQSVTQVIDFINGKCLPEL